MNDLHIPVTILSEKEFIDTYCTSEHRQSFLSTIEDLFEYAHNTGTRTVFVGGSFITDKRIPNDIDVLLAYNRDRDIPRADPNPAIAAIIIDMQFSSYEDEATLNAYVYMFGHGRDGMPRDVVQINIAAGQEPYKWDMPEEARLRAVMDTYVRRRIIQRNPHKGILVSVHGLYSTGDWNVDLAPIASSQGWIFAPYTYTENDWHLLCMPWKRKKTVENFRHWLYDICQRYKDHTTNLCIAGHSYGTYIVGSYLNGFDQLPVDLNAIVLTGSVLNHNYDWKNHFDQARVGSVMNIYSPNDWMIGAMPNWDGKKFIGMDKLFGSAGQSGFLCKDPRLIQRKLDVLHHTNGITRDIIETVWMPFLNNNHNARHVNQAVKK